MNVRSFVAVRLPVDVREDLAGLQARLRERGVRARWVRGESLHLTLKFLGELGSEVFDRVAASLGVPLQAPGPLSLRVRGLGAFPSAVRARVVWAGLEGDVAELSRVAREVEARTEAVGIPRETRPFRPHLTLGRARGSAGILGLVKALEEEAEHEGPWFRVEELVLFESRLRPEGPLYLPRLSIPLT